MAGGWGTAKNGMKIGCIWDSIELNSAGDQARITNPHVSLDRDVNIVDSSNSLSWSGGAVTDGSADNINCDGSGTKTLKTVTGQWQTLSYTSNVTATFAATFEGLSYAGGDLTNSETVTYPKRLYDTPVAPTSVAFTGSLGNFTVTWVNKHTTDAPWTTLVLHRVESVSGTDTAITVSSPSTATSKAETGLDPTKRYYWYLVVTNPRGSVTSAKTATSPQPLNTLTMNDSTPDIGQAVIFTINNNGSGYDSLIRVDDQTAMARGSGLSATYTLTPAVWGPKLASASSKAFTVYLDTYVSGGGALVGTMTYSLTVAVPNADPYLPIGTPPTIAETVTLIETAFGPTTYVQGYSVIRVTALGSAGANATISKKEVIVNALVYDVTASGYADIAVTWTTTPTAQSRITDSRGRVATSSAINVKGYLYAKPTITTFTARRCLSDGTLSNAGTYVKFDITAGAGSIINGVEKNTMGYTAHLAVNGVANGAPLVTKAANSTLTYSGTTAALGGGAYSTSSAYSFILTVTDRLASSTTTRVVSIPTEIVPFSIGNNGVAIGKVYDDTTKAIDAVGSVKISGNLDVGGTLTGAAHSHPPVPPVELAANVNLNTVTAYGNYTQSQSGEATLALNYPEAAKAGFLEVFFNPGNTTADTWWQRYTPRSPDHDHFWVRGWVGTVFGPWYRFDADPGPVVLESGSFTPATGWTVTYGDIRTFGRVVQFNVRATRTTALTVPADGNISNNLICTITNVAVRPAGTIALATAATGPLCAIQVEPTGAVNISAVAPGVTMLNSEFTGAGVWII